MRAISFLISSTDCEVTDVAVHGVMGAMGVILFGLCFAECVLSELGRELYVGSLGMGGPCVGMPFGMFDIAPRYTGTFVFVVLAEATVFTLGVGACIALELGTDAMKA